MNLFLDDFRNPIECVSYTKDVSYSQLEWVVVRSHNEFVHVITEHFEEHKKLPNLISFDHDLAEEHYDDSMYTGRYDDLYSQFKEKTGFDSAKWLVDFCIDNKLFLPQFKVHSMNPAGKKNIISLLEQFARHQSRGQGLV